MNGGNQALCDAILAASESDTRQDRLAAALVLLAAVDDDLAVDADAMPKGLRAALFNDDAI